MDKDIYSELALVLGKEQIKINEPMSMYTSFKVGGKADFLVEPNTAKEVADVVYTRKQHLPPYYVIGNGSNLLVGDKGYRGVIIHISTKLSSIFIEKKKESNSYTVTAESGILLSKLSHEIAMNELTGFEFAAGIPGSLGGAITMNAGAYDGQMKDCVIGATVIDEQGDIVYLNKEQLLFGYRMSAIQKRGLIVLSATFELVKGDKDTIFNKINDLNSRRKEKQPLEYPSAGSAFKRPTGYYAGKLIMDSGLRGFRIGDIMVSTKHCGFIVNVGQGTAKDVRRVIEHVIHTVDDKFGVILEPEIRFLGEF